MFVFQIQMNKKDWNIYWTLVANKKIAHTHRKINKQREEKNTKSLLFGFYWFPLN